MKNQNSRLLLQESLNELDQAISHLKFSYHSATTIEATYETMDETQLQIVEAFTSRFSRVVDLLINKCLRALDRFEMADSLTLLDVANRAAKRGLVPSSDWIRELKDTRNRIAHDYSGSEMKEILKFYMESTLPLINCCEQVKDYASARL